MFISDKIFAIALTFLFFVLLSFPVHISANSSIPESELKEYRTQYVKNKIKTNAKQTECLAKAMYYEASGESYEGKLAVAQVVLNRVKSYHYPKTICGVVYQKTKNNDNQTVYQFSWTNYPPKITNGFIWRQCMEIAQRSLTNNVLHDKLSKLNALYFHEVHVNPDWKNYKKVMRIGNHVFYK